MKRFSIVRPEEPNSALAGIAPGTFSWRGGFFLESRIVEKRHRLQYEYLLELFNSLYRMLVDHRI